MYTYKKKAIRAYFSGWSSVIKARTTLRARVEAQAFLCHEIGQNTFHYQIDGRGIRNIRGDLISYCDDEVAQRGINSLPGTHNRSSVYLMLVRRAPGDGQIDTLLFA
jgi:hypothetical protein